MTDARKEPVAAAAHELLELRSYVFAVQAIVDPDGGPLETEARMMVGTLLRHLDERIYGLSERLDTHATAAART